MTLIEWSPALSVEIQSIDAQHQKLFGYINELYDALVEKKEREIVGRIFLELEDYTHTHFTFEEAYFKKFNFEGTDSHVREHSEFINRIKGLKKQIQDDAADVEDLVDFLVDWLMHHIKGTDHGYIKCFHEHGMK